MHGVEEARRAFSCHCAEDVDGRGHGPAGRPRTAAEVAAATANLELAAPGLRRGRREDFDHRARLEPEGRWCVAGGDGHGAEIGQRRRDAEGNVEPVVDRDAVLHVQHAVVDAAHVEQPVVFLRESRHRGNGLGERARLEPRRQIAQDLASGGLLRSHERVEVAGDDQWRVAGQVQSHRDLHDRRAADDDAAGAS